MSYNFLKNLVIKEIVPTRKLTKTPEGVSLRVYPSGRVFPSTELVRLFGLEYDATNKEAGNGIDFFEAHAWGAYPKDQPNTIFVAAVPRTEAKIDLFDSRRSETSVIEQGPINKDLWTLITKLDPTAATAKAVDLQVIVDAAFNTTDGIYYVPKVITRGERKGQATTIRRENITLYPLSILVPVEASVASDVDVNQEELQHS
jgi:hypothetical protein